MQHTNLCTSFDEHKISLTQRNLYSEMYKFSKRCLFPCNVPIRYALMYAIQSAAYLPSPEWLKRYAKMDMDEAQSLWEVIFLPSSCTISHVDAIFFDGSRVSSGRNNKRYFISGGNFELPPSKRPSSDSSFSRSAYERIVDTLQTSSQSSSSCTEKPHYFDSDFTPLTGNEATLTMSTNDSMFETELRCPDTLDEMMLLVRQCRAKSRDVMQEAFLHNEERFISSISQSSCITPDVQSRIMPSIDLSKYLKPRQY